MAAMENRPSPAVMKCGSCFQLYQLFDGDPPHECKTVPKADSTHKLSTVTVGDMLLVAHPMANPLMVTYENGGFQLRELTRQQFNAIQNAGKLPSAPHL